VFHCVSSSIVIGAKFIEPNEYLKFTQKYSIDFAYLLLYIDVTNVSSHGGSMKKCGKPCGNYRADSNVNYGRVNPDEKNCAMSVDWITTKDTGQRRENLGSPRSFCRNFILLSHKSRARIIDRGCRRPCADGKRNVALEGDLHARPGIMRSSRRSAFRSIEQTWSI